MEKDIHYIDGRHDGCKLLYKKVGEGFIFINQWEGFKSVLPEGVEYPDGTDFTVVINHLNELNPPPPVEEVEE